MSATNHPRCMRGDSRRPCFHGFVAKRVARIVLPKIDARVVLDDGTILGAGGPESPRIDAVDSDAFFRRVGHEPKIGFGDAYVEGDWTPGEGTDLAVAMYPFARVIDDAVPTWVQRMSALAEQGIPQSMRNTLTGARKNIEAHYDLSNDLFAQFLDPSLTYSSAMFDDAKPWGSQSLQEAQERKVDAALDRARVGEGTRLLEIGTGWGTLAIRAAQRGATVTTVTLSVEQAALASARAEAAGVADRIDIRIQDYREVTGEYDAVVSIEMIEAVGEEYWQTYFDAIDRLLAPGGVAVVQAILMSHERYRVTRRALSWIQKHIFPGGIIPSVRAIEEVTARTTLRITEQFHFGHHYAETLRRWRSTFLANWDAIAPLGLEPRFRRIWEFYLAYSEAGFETDYLDVAQFRFEREVAA